MTDSEDDAADPDAGPDRSESDETPSEAETVDVSAFRDAVEQFGRPVVTAEEVARALDRSQAETDDALAGLADGRGVERLDVSNDPVVWYPTEWRRLADRERIVVFPKRRELVVDQPTQFTRAQLSQFAHLVDTTRDGGYMYEIRQEDVWAAPFDDLDGLFGTVRDVLPDRSPHLEEWLEDQWKRARQFVLTTDDEDGYVVLEAASEDLMGNVARQKLDDGQLRAPLSDTESWVAEEAVAEVKRVLYEAGYPVRDERDLDTGEELDASLNLQLRDYQREWVSQFVEAKSGVLVGPPGSGKTVAGMGALEAVGGETLVLVPGRELASQWHEELLAHTTLAPDQIGEYHGGTKDIRPVTIATYQTAGMDRHRQLFDQREWGLIIFDECQHIPSRVFRRSAELQSKHRLGLSVHGDTVIPIKRGERVSLERIEAFATDYLNEEVGVAETENVETLGVTTDGTVTWTGVKAVMRHEHGDEMYRVRSRNGRQVTITADHSVMVFDGETNEITGKRPNDLSDSDYLLQPNAIPSDAEGTSTVNVLQWLDEGYVLLDENTPESVFTPLYEENVGSNKDRYNWKNRGNLPLEVAREIDIDREYVRGVYVHKRTNYIPPEIPAEDFARLVGLFVADGVLGEHRVEFYATDRDKSEAERFKEYIQEIHPDGNVTTVSNGENCTTVRISGPLVHVFENIGLSNGAREKSVPEIILSSPSMYEPFIEGIILGDGHRQERDRGRKMVTVSTSSDSLAQEINYLLSSLGYVGGNYRRDEDIGVREAEHDVATNNLVRFDPRNGDKQPRNAMVPFTETLKQQYESIVRTPRNVRYAGDVERRLDHGLSDRKRLNDDEVRTLVDRAETAEHEWLADTDIAMLDIESVTEVESAQYVYDLSTDEENFLGNHLFCHNSATPVREDDKEEEIFTLIGPPIGTDWDALFEAGYVQEPEVQIRYVPWDDETYRHEYGSAEGHEKRQIAASNPAKVEEIRHLRAEHPHAKTLVFVEYLDQGEQLAEELGVPFISGEMRHARRQHLLQEFKSGDRDTLIVSRVGDEGIDLPDAELAVVASGLGGSRRQGAQRAGRTMRPTGNARMYVLATRGTTEEDFARRRMQHLSAKGVRVTERSAEAVSPRSARGDSRDE